MPHASSFTRKTDGYSIVVRLLVIVILVVCMTAPEEVIYPTLGTTALNPYTGTVKTVLFGLALLLIALCPSRLKVWVIAKPFLLSIAWAFICWIASGAEALPLRNVVSSFGGIIVLVSLCKASHYVGGIRGMARCLATALGISVGLSIACSAFGLQPALFERPLKWQMEWFHGVGRPGLIVAGCISLITWQLGEYLIVSSSFLFVAMLPLMAIPVLVAERTLLFGIFMAFAVATWIAIRWNPNAQILPGVRPRRWRAARLIVLVTLVVACVTGVFVVKSLNQPGRELSGREVIWPIALDSVQAHPYLGLGPFGDVQLLRFDENHPEVGSAHSDYLGVAVCYGVPGLLFWIFALIWIGSNLRIRVAWTRDDAACRYAAILSFTAFVVTMTAENVFRDPRAFTLYLLWPALCVVAQRSRRSHVYYAVRLNAGQTDRPGARNVAGTSRRREE